MLGSYNQISSLNAATVESKFEDWISFIPYYIIRGFPVLICEDIVHIYPQIPQTFLYL